jgi:flavodoxin
MESGKEKNLKALVIYYSTTGNTGKVAGAIQDVLSENE